LDTVVYFEFLWLFAVLYVLKIIAWLECTRAKQRNIKLKCDFQQQMFLNFIYDTPIFRQQILITHSKRRRAVFILFQWLAIGWKLPELQEYCYLESMGAKISIAFSGVRKRKF